MKTLLVCLLLAGAAAAHAASPLLTVAEWVTLDYDWPAMNQSRLQWLDAGSFIPENCALAGVKYWRGRYFVTVPVRFSFCPPAPPAHD